MEITFVCNFVKDRISLNAVDFVDVEVDSQDGIDFRYSGEELDILWDIPFSVGEERMVVIKYRVVDPGASLTSVQSFTHHDDPVGGFHFHVPSEGPQVRKELFCGTDLESEVSVMPRSDDLLC